MSLLTFKLLAAIAILAVAVIGGVIPLMAARHDSSRRFFSLGNAFAGGLFLGVGFIHLLPDGMEKLEGIVEFPLAALLAALLGENEHIAALIEGSFNAIAAGTFIYVAAVEIIDAEMSTREMRLAKFVLRALAGDDDVPMPVRDTDRVVKFELIVVGISLMALLFGVARPLSEDRQPARFLLSTDDEVFHPEVPDVIHRSETRLFQPFKSGQLREIFCLSRGCPLQSGRRSPPPDWPPRDLFLPCGISPSGDSCSVLYPI